MKLHLLPFSKKVLFLILFFGFISGKVLFAQPINDHCLNAINLGTLPTPNSCAPTSVNPGIGAPLTFNYSNVGATASNPYIYTTGCSSTASADVWFRVNLTGGQLSVTVNGTFSNGVTITIFKDDCSNLQGWGCAQGPAPLTYVCNNILNNTSCLIRVSGIGLTDQAPFTMTVSNNDDCSICNLGYDLVANPAPANGTYLPGQTVNFCYTINQWRMVGINWLHGVQVEFGDGWDQSTLVTYPVISQDGQGTWGWYDADSSYMTSLEFGPGYYYQSVLGDIDGSLPDTVTGDNWGDYASGIIAPPWVFCWDVTTSTSFDTSLTDLAVTVSSTADGESGSWVNFGCSNDPSAYSNAILVFCGFPIVSTTPSCLNGSTGSALANGQGFAPFDYLWLDSNQDTVAFNQGIFGPDSITNIPTGFYTIIATDSTGCGQAMDIYVEPLQESYFTFPDSLYCYYGTNPVPDSIYISGGTFSASPNSLTIDPSTGEIDITSSIPDSIYTITYITNFTCGPDTTLFQIKITDTSLNAYFNYPDTIFCANSVMQLPDTVISSAFDYFYATDTLLTVDPASGELTITNQMANNTFNVYHVTNFGCRDTAVFTFSVNPTDIAYFTYPVDSVCAGDPIVFPDSVTMPGGTFTMLTSFISIDTVTGAVDFANANPNTILTIQHETDSLCPTVAYQNIVVRRAASYFYYFNYQVCIEGADPVPTLVSTPGADFWSNDPTLVIDSITGQIDITSMVVGNNYIIYHASSNICTDTTTDIITAIGPIDPTFNYAASEFCLNTGTAAPDTLISATGSFFSIPAGVTVSSPGGVIDLNTSTAGTYTLTHITSTLCPDTTSISISLFDSDDSSFNYISSVFCMNSDSLSTVPIAAQTGTYSAIPSGITINNATGEIDLTASGFNVTYTVIHVTDGLCPTADSVDIEIQLCDLVIFTAFTPNGDNVNDFWYIAGLENYSGNHVSVFNRWGDILWEASDYDNLNVMWTGENSSGTPVSPGTYFYIIDFGNGEKVSGYIELTR